MDRFPASLIEFQQQFGSEEACARYLADLRWPNGFVCPCCQSRRNWALKTKPDTFECANCERQTSVTAGPILHASKLPRQQAAADRVVSGGLLHGAPHQWPVGAPVAVAARPRLVPHGLDACRQAASGHGGAGP